MSKGYSLHLGLNRLDEVHYRNLRPLQAAVNDALYWEGFARSQGYVTQSLHDDAATVAVVTNILREYTGLLQPGDILLLTYAGHGGQIVNEKPAGLDAENYDQTWCLYDRQWLDDEIYEALEALAEGVRVVVVADSCHSGTSTRVGEIDLSLALSGGMAMAAQSRGWASRKLPQQVENAILQEFGAQVYGPVLKKFRHRGRTAGVRAAVKLLAACQDDQETLDGAQNGLFTQTFQQILLDSRRQQDTAEQLIAACSEYYAFPNPQFFQYGCIVPAFDAAFPFRIDIPDAGKVTGYRQPALAAIPRIKQPDFASTDWDDTVEVKKSAVLRIEIERAIDEQIVAGKDLIILSHQKTPDKQVWMVELPNISYQHGWSAAHALAISLGEQGLPANVEPVLSVNPAQRARVLSREADKDNPGYISDWPPSMQADKVGIGWHLDDQHAQLTKAQQAVLGKADAYLDVRIAHLDTGYVEGHVALPAKLNRAQARNFVEGENPTLAIDPKDSGQDGHGLGTITLLAGNKVLKAATFEEYEGYIGGIPFADVLPIRISDSVVIWNTEHFCEAVYYAIQTGCEVITMSMAGKPSARMAKAVNDAYEAGMVIVTAAGNNWYKGQGAILPKCVMFPAAFERVIAATGAMYDQRPYDVNFIQQGRFDITTKFMQGSWGPASRMHKALAAYTPNLPWASTVHTFLRSGGGTSSATPQIAAAAALYIAYHRKELMARGYYQPGQQWKKVEAVRTALFQSAAKGAAFAEWKKYYGHGILRAYDALLMGVPPETALHKAPPAESSYSGLIEAAGSFFKNRHLFRASGPRPQPEMLATELLHLLQTDPQFYDLFATLDLSDVNAVAAVIRTDEFQEQVLRSAYASDFLKATMADNSGK